MERIEPVERNGGTAGKLTIPYFRPSIGPEEHEAVDAVLSSGWLTTGRTVKEFEARFSDKPFRSRRARKVFASLPICMSLSPQRALRLRTTRRP